MALIVALMLAVMLIAGHGNHSGSPGSQPAAPEHIERAAPGDAAQHE